MNKFLISASAVAIIVSTPSAFAQSTPPAADEQEAGIGEIIVTAQKRAENSQKAPLAVTSLDAETLSAAHIDGATDLQRVVPNLNAQAGGGAGDPGGAAALFTIRGLGASAAGPQGSTGVAVHFDGVYRQDGLSNSEFFDLERIEVSPGPQGTLYGRSAAAGAINVLPAKPSLAAAAGAASVQYGNYDALTLQGMINLPLSDQVAVRAAFQKQKHDGYYSNGYDSLDALSGRAQLLFKPDEALSIRLAANFARFRGVGSGNVFIDGPAFPGLVALVPQAGNRDLRTASVSEYCAVNGVIVNTCRQSIRINKTSLLAEINYDFGPATLTLLPAYNESVRRTRNANAPSALSVYDQRPYTNRQTNLEARLSDSGKSDLKWVIGGSYYRNKVETYVDQFINTLNAPGAAPLGAPFVTVTAINAFQDQKSRQTSYAAFAQGTYPVVDNVRLTLGGRYNWDESSGKQVLGNTYTRFYRVNSTGVALFSVPGLPVTTPEQAGSKSFKAFTYRAAIDVDVGPQSLVYASVGTGYKPGSLNDGGPRSSTPTTNPNFALAPEQFFGPERVTHYELGSKNRFASNTLQVNAVVYYDSYKNYQNGQTQVVNPLQFGALGFVVTNAGQARIYGAELAVKWQPTANDMFDISANYLDAEFTSYIAPAFLAPGNAPAPARSFAGFPLPNAPRLSGNISYRHSFDLGGSGSIDASAFTHLTEGYWVFFAQAPGTYQKGHSNTTLDLRWTSAGGSISVGAFVKNLEDHDVKVFGGFTAGYTSVGLAPPRTYGASAAFKF